MSDDLRQFAPATERNRHVILPILQRVLPPAGTVLEIGSGSGQHAVFFAAQLPQLQWQPSERDVGALASIRAWVAHAGVRNVAAPLLLDIDRGPWPVAQADAVVAINVLHYTPWPTTPALFAGAARVLPPGGVLYCYGPFRRGGRHTAPSNAEFDAWLKARDPASGIRDAEAVDALAAAQGLRLVDDVEMPANNRLRIWRR